MLDISINNANKVLDSSEKITIFLNQHSIIEEKVDGVKLSLLRNEKDFDTSNFANNFILSYKGAIIYEEDFFALPVKSVKRHSIGNAQYVIPYEHFKRINHTLKRIPKCTEFFIEFLMEKPTLTRDYTDKHKMVLIGYAKTSFREEGGRLVTFPREMETELNKAYSAALKIEIPRTIVKGLLYPYKNLAESSVDATFAKLLRKNKSRFESADVIEYYSTLKETLLDLPSKYGGVMEGVVIKQNEKLLKIVQPDQYDKDVRRKKKDRFQMSADRESAYFSAMKNLARTWLDDMYQEERFALMNGAMTNGESGLTKPYTFSERLSKLSYIAYRKTELIELFPEHDKKSTFRKQEDFHYLLKYLLLKDLPINNNAMFIGRLQPPTKMHMSIIREGLRNFNSVIVAIVKGKKSEMSQNPFSYDTQREILLDTFSEKVEVIQVSSGNIFSAIEKSKRNINAVLCGGDRFESYSKQLLNNPEIKIICFPRDKDGVSGTKLRDALMRNDKNAFNRNVDKNVKKFYERLRKEITEHRENLPLVS